MLEQAKAGDPAAIAALIERRLQQHQIQIAVVCQSECLTITLMAKAVPNQQQMVDFIYQGLNRLQPVGIRRLVLKGQTTVSAEASWAVTLPLPTDAESSETIAVAQAAVKPMLTKPSGGQTAVPEALAVASTPSISELATSSKPQAQDRPNQPPQTAQVGVSPCPSSRVAPKSWWQRPINQPYLLLGLVAAFGVVQWQTFSMTLPLLLLAIAAVPARLAWGRGYNFFNWYAYSFALPFVAVFHIMVLPKRANGQNDSATTPTAIAAVTSPPPSLPVDFAGKSLVGRNFESKNLTGANFTGADLSGANFARAICTGANFSQAKIGGACFKAANLTQADFTQATVAWQGSWVGLAAKSLPIWGWVLVLMLAVNLLSLSVSSQYNRFADFSLGCVLWVGGLVAFGVVVLAQNPQRLNLQRNLTIAIAALVTITSLTTVQTLPGLTLVKLGFAVLAGVLIWLPSPQPNWARWGTGLGLLGGLSVVNLWSLLGVGGNTPFLGTLVTLHILVLSFATVTGRLIAVFTRLWFVNFERATLNQANFTHAHLNRANFLKAQVTDVIWQQTALTGAIRPNGQRIPKKLDDKV